MNAPPRSGTIPLISHLAGSFGGGCWGTSGCGPGRSDGDGGDGKEGGWLKGINEVK